MLYIIIFYIICLSIIIYRYISLKKSISKADTIIRFTKYRRGTKFNTKKKK